MYLLRWSEAAALVCGRNGRCKFCIYLHITDLCSAPMESSLIMITDLGLLCLKVG